MTKKNEDEVWYTAMGSSPAPKYNIVKYVYEKGGACYYIRNGVFHRTTGPAIIYADGRQEWWRDGDRVTDPLVILLLDETYKIKNNNV